MNILVFQHLPIEDPGYLKDKMLADNWHLHTIELDQGEQIPEDLDAFDALICMGGPMNTWMEEEYPWLVQEKKAIQKFVTQLEKPYLGFCLGAQLLGDVLGSPVVKSLPPEVGILDINLNAAANEDVLVKEFPKNIKALQWHSYEVKDLSHNYNVTLLGSSETTKYQLFRYKNNAWGIQFHLEVQHDTIEKWSKVLDYNKALKKSTTVSSIEDFNAKVQEHIQNMNKNCTRLYENFKTKVLNA